MSDEDQTLFFVLFMLAVGMISCCAMGYGIGVEHARREAINRGYAQHNPKTGVFEWIEPPAKDAE